LNVEFPGGFWRYKLVRDSALNSSTADFSEAFGGNTIGEGSVYTFPSGAEPWAGFANMNNALYPMSFSEAGSITFNGSVADGGSADVRFRLEFNPHPDVEPSYDTATVTVSGATPTEYTVAIPSQGSNTFSSLIMYIVERDVAVTITDVVVDGEIAEPIAQVNVTFQVDMSAVDTHPEGVYLAGGGVFGQDGLLMTDNGSDVWSVTAQLDANTRVLYKFRNQPSFGTWDGFEDTFGAGDCFVGDYAERFVDVADADITLPVVAYGSCTADPYVPPGGPEVPAAPAATEAADSVLSIFSTTYGNLDGTDFNPNWGQSTSVDVGDNLLYTGLNYQGTMFPNQNVSGYDYLNIDYYVVESSAVNFFLISPGAEKPYALDVSTAGQWNNVQIPLSHYDNVNLADVFQFKVDGNGSVAFNNIYFGGRKNQDPVLVTFQVDMSELETNSDGVYIAHGSFGQEGYAMTDNGNDVWSVTLELLSNTRYTYKFRNQPSYGTWDGAESGNILAAGGCVTGQYNDRFVDVPEEHITLPAVAYESCKANLDIGDVIEFSPSSVASFGGVDAFTADGVVEVIKNEGAEIWAGNIITSGKYNFPLDENQSAVSADVFSTVAAPIRMILQSQGDPSSGIELDVLHEGNGWQTLTWDFKEVNGLNSFGNMVDISSVSNLDTLVMMPNFGLYGEGNTYKYDNFTFGGYSQKVSVNNSPKGVLGKTTTLEVSYDTSDENNQLPGLGLRVHFNSNLLSFNQITDLIEQDLIINGEGPFSDDEDFDNDPLTDKYLSFGWASLYNNWPDTELPAVLMNISFDVSDEIDTDVVSVTSINFSDTALAAGYEKDFESYDLELISTTWDFDENGVADALSDGLMMLRYCFGLRGDYVTSLAMSPDSSMSSDEVVAKIESALEIADIDNDGEVGALTDGLLLLRYLFGLEGDILTIGVVSPDASRSSNEAIEAYLETYMPVM
ncbi:MAG: hypothetical protein ACPHV4_01950, partial [Porticoccaceae bacterium]